MPQSNDPLLDIHKDQQAAERSLQGKYQEAVEIQMGLTPFSIHPTRFRYGASDSICPRLAYLKCHLNHLVPEFELSTLRKFRVGDIFHKMADEGIDKMLWAMKGEVIRVSSFELECFKEMFEGLRPGCVQGTPDHILIAPKLKHMYLVDQKSANDYGFKDNKKNGASIYHGIQVGTYLDGLMNSPLKDFVQSGEMFICYMSKEAVEVAVRKVPATYLRDAKAYWQIVANAQRANMLPPALPREKWACKYCPFFKGEKEPLTTCSAMESLDSVRDFMGEDDNAPLVEEKTDAVQPE